MLSIPRFFGGGFGGGQQEERTPKGHDVNADLYVTLKDLYLGKELKARPGFPSA
jgi:DnaJ-class molecular chaperone